MIDPVTNLLEIAHVKPTKTSAKTVHVFDTTWLSRYPRPSKVVCDEGPEFVGFEWDDLLAKAGIKKSFITSRNPQSNGLIKRSHQAISQVIQVNRNISKSKGWTLQSSLLMLWMEKT